MANIRMCTGCGEIYKAGTDVCSTCGRGKMTSLPYSQIYWDKQTPEKRAEIQKKHIAELNVVTKEMRQKTARVPVTSYTGDPGMKWRSYLK